MLKKALKIANKAHKGQFRKHSGLPYILHPLEVAKQLTIWGVKHEDILSAAILHDVLEDCDVNDRDRYYIKIVKSGFGLTVADIVNDLTFDKELWTKRGYLESFKDKTETHVGSLVVKMADRYCNIKDFELSGDPYVTKYTMKALPLWEAFRERNGEIRSCHYFGDKVADAIGNSYLQYFTGY